MKTQRSAARVMILGWLVALALGMAHAQIGSDVLKVKVPFEFSIGAQRFPAGEYRFKSLVPHTMLLTNEAGQVLTSIATNSIESGQVQRSVTFVFNGYDGHYFLAQIWREGDNIGQVLMKTPAEIEMAKNSARKQVALRVVARR